MTQLLPNSKIAEQAILSHVLLNKPRADIIFNRISIDMFYSDKYKIIYEAVCEVRKKNLEVNLDTVTDYLTNHQTDTNDYDNVLTELINQRTRTGELSIIIIYLKIYK